MAILAVEEEASIMGIALAREGITSTLGRILLGQTSIVGAEQTMMVDGYAIRSQRQHAPLTALQAHSALADSMQVDSAAASIHWAWRRMLETHEV